jgi:RNA polymerase sigma-70 factor (ECF subfamily)
MPCSRPFRAYAFAISLSGNIDRADDPCAGTLLRAMANIVRSNLNEYVRVTLHHPPQPFPIEYRKRRREVETPRSSRR